MTDEYVDISFTIKDSELRGRKYVRNLRTGQFEWRGGFEDVPLGVIVQSSEEPVEPLPEASVEQPSADPAPPIKKSVTKRKKVQRGA